MAVGDVIGLRFDDWEEVNQVEAIDKAVSGSLIGGLPVSKECEMQFITTSSITVSATPIEPDPDWQDFGNCKGVDPDLFFPERGASTREAKECCRGCEVRHDCLEFALQNGEKFGIWGGLSERERRRIRRQRSQVARSSIKA
jgi:WhiB family redox-sensing transcriptional regulator